MTKEKPLSEKFVANLPMGYIHADVKEAVEKLKEEISHKRFMYSYQSSRTKPLKIFEEDILKLIDSIFGRFE